MLWIPLFLHLHIEPRLLPPLPSYHIASLLFLIIFTMDQIPTQCEDSDPLRSPHAPAELSEKTKGNDDILPVISAIPRAHITFYTSKNIRLFYFLVGFFFCFLLLSYVYSVNFAKMACGCSEQSPSSNQSQSQTGTLRYYLHQRTRVCASTCKSEISTASSAQPLQGVWPSSSHVKSLFEDFDSPVGNTAELRKERFDTVTSIVANGNDGSEPSTQSSSFVYDTDLWRKLLKIGSKRNRGARRNRHQRRRRSRLR